MCEKFGLTFDAEVPIIAAISRLVDAKGFDLIAEVIHDLMKLDVNMVLLGTGEKKYHKLFEEVQKKVRENSLVILD